MKYKILEYGSLEVIDKMGDDQAVVDAARVSYDPSSTNISRTNDALIEYLISHEHWSPLEMCEIKFIVEAPILTIRQWVKHNINMNEISGRYSILPDSTHIPEPMGQDPTNKQKSIDNLTSETKDSIKKIHDQFKKESRFLYEQCLELGQSREQARGLLGTSQYTKCMIKTNLRDLLFFIKARSHETAQPEIQEYANVLSKIVSEWTPSVWKSFEDHQLNSIKLSNSQVKILQNYINLDLEKASQLKITQLKDYLDDKDLS